MKSILLPLNLLIAVSVFAQTGYDIKITFKPFRNQYIYLGHYFGKQYPIIDSALLNEKSEAEFKGANKLPGGIYLVGYPNKAGFFEILVDKQQHFSVVADTATIKKGIQFTNSSDNVLFNNYQQYMIIKGKAIEDAKEHYRSATNEKDSAHWNTELNKIDKTIQEYREDIIKKNPDNILSVLFITMREPELTGPLKDPKTKADSLSSYYYFKQHFWDGVNFWDGRLAYTTLFEEKLDKYYNQLVAPNPDSVIKELDWMLGYSSINEEMNRFLLLKFVNRYLNQKYMWEDAVFVHLFEKYFAQKQYDWLNDKGRKTITDRAYSLMSNIFGKTAENITLPDSTGKAISLYDQQAPFIIVCFWDPTCGHCKETLPKIDSFYLAKWKAIGLKIFAVAKETDGTKKDWLDFINSHHLEEWTNVYYSKEAEKTRIDANIPGYSQLYDVLSFPTLYLLDKDKRIVAKKLAYDQIDEVLQLKLNGQ